MAHATSLTGTLPSELGRCSMLGTLCATASSMSHPFNSHTFSSEFLLFGWSEVQGILPEELGQLSNLST